MKIKLSWCGGGSTEKSESRTYSDWSEAAANGYKPCGTVPGEELRLAMESGDRQVTVGRNTAELVQES